MMASEKEKGDPFEALDGRKASTISGDGSVIVGSLKDADEALSFLENHPRSAEIAEEVPYHLNRVSFIMLSNESYRALQYSKILCN